MELNIVAKNGKNREQVTEVSPHPKSLSHWEKDCKDVFPKNKTIFSVLIRGRIPRVFSYLFLLVVLSIFYPKRLLAQQEQQLQLKDFNYWASLCDSLAKAQKHEDAVKACDQAIALNPNDGATWMDRGDAQLALVMYAEASASYDQVLRQEPNHSLVLAKQCGVLSELGRQDDAIAACEKALEADSNWGDGSPALAWYNRGLVLSRLNKPEQALDSYEWAIKINPDYSLAWAGQCLVLSDINQYEEAMTSCDKALQAANWGNSSPAVGWANQGVVFRKLKQYDKALASYDSALALNPKDEKTWTEQGLVLELLGRHGEALVSYDWALKISPKYSEALVNKCAALNRSAQKPEDFTAALAACEMAIQEGDGRWGEEGIAFAWNQRGNALTGLGRYEEALASIQRAIALQPDYASAWSNRAVTLWRLGRYDEALASNQRATDIEPSSSQAWFNQGRILTTLGRFDEAAVAYQQALAGDANIGDPSTLAAIWVNQSSLLWRLERYREAIAAADNALTIDSKLAEAWYNKGLSYMSLRRYEDAVTSYDRAIGINPQNANFWTGKGIALRFQEKYPEALAALQQAVTLDPNNAQAKTNQEIVQQELTPPMPSPVAPMQ